MITYTRKSTDFKKTRGLRLSLCAAVFLRLAANTSTACEVPVFQYALNLWPPDPYEAVMVHDGEPEALEALAALREARGAKRLNLVVRETSSDATAENFADLLAANPPPETPWLIIRYPVRYERRKVVWAGKPETDAISAWIDSPLRRDLTKALKAKASAVWIFMESGDRGKDEAAYRTLRDELDRLQRVLLVSGADDGSIEISPEFEVLRLKRGNKEESALREMLLRSERDLLGHTDVPMVFPVYGRGLVLYALLGAGINERTIDAAAEFITGPCSCEVKSESPGMDLLLLADWEESEAGGPGDFEERAARAEALVAEIDYTIAPTGADEQKKQPAAEDRPSRRNGLAIGIFVTIAIAGAYSLKGFGRSKG